MNTWFTLLAPCSPRSRGDYVTQWGSLQVWVTGWGSEEAVAEEHGAPMQEELCPLDEESEEQFSQGCASFCAGTVSEGLAVNAVQARKSRCVRAASEGQGCPLPAPVAPEVRLADVPHCLYCVEEGYLLRVGGTHRPGRMHPAVTRVVC